MQDRATVTAECMLYVTVSFLLVLTDIWKVNHMVVIHFLNVHNFTISLRQTCIPTLVSRYASVRISLRMTNFLISLSIITNHVSKYHPGFLIVNVIIVLLLLLSLSLIALVSYCLFYCNLSFSYSATVQPQVWNKLSVSVCRLNTPKASGHLLNVRPLLKFSQLPIPSDSEWMKIVHTSNLVWQTVILANSNLWIKTVQSSVVD